MGPADVSPLPPLLVHWWQEPSPLKAVTELGLRKAGAELRDPLASSGHEESGAEIQKEDRTPAMPLTTICGLVASDCP